MDKVDFFYKLGYDMVKTAKDRESLLPDPHQVIGSVGLGALPAISAFKLGLPKSKILAAGLVPTALGIASSPFFNAATPKPSEVLFPFLVSKKERSRRLKRGLIGSALLGAGSVGTFTLPEILASGISKKNIGSLARKGAIGLGLGGVLPALVLTSLNK